MGASGANVMMPGLYDRLNTTGPKTVSWGAYAPLYAASQSQEDESGDQAAMSHVGLAVLIVLGYFAYKAWK